MVAVLTCACESALCAVLGVLMSAAGSTLRTNNTNREMANICITITCLLMFATPERDFCHGAVLVSCCCCCEGF